MRSGFRYAVASVLLSIFVFSRGPTELEERDEMYNKCSSTSKYCHLLCKKCPNLDGGDFLKESLFVKLTINAVMHKASSGVSRVIRVLTKHLLYFLTLYIHFLKIKAIIGF